VPNPTTDDDARAADATADVIVRYLNGSVSDEQLRALNVRLRLHRPSRELFVRFARLHGFLTEHAISGRAAADRGWDLLSGDDASEDLDESGSLSLHDATIQPAIRVVPPSPDVAVQAPPSYPRPVEPPGSGTPWRWISGGAGLAAAIMLAVGVAIHRRASSEPVADERAWTAPPVAEARPAATLASAVNADLRGPDGLPVLSGNPMPSGMVSLQRGWARVDFLDGATVVIEAPAMVRVVSGSNLEVRAGRVSADVPPAAHGFAITSPFCRVVDLGTEFGVEVRPDGRTDVGVFKGKIALSDQAEAPAVVTQGQGRHLDTLTGPAVAAQIAPAQFVRVEDFNRWTAAVTPAERVRAAEQQACRDPSMSLFYSFGDQSVRRDAIVNKATATFGRYDLPLNGEGTPAWGEGRLAGLSALDFNPGREQRLLVPDFPVTRTGAMTCTAWVYCRSRSPWASIAKNWGSSKGGAFHFGLNDPDGTLALELGTDATPASGAEVPMNRISEGTGQPFPLGKWVFVAFTCDGHTATLFRNGYAVTSGPCKPIPAKAPVHSLAIGFKTGDDGMTPAGGSQVGYWDGRMGTLALYDRALAPNEVMSQYAAGMPTTPQP
jgi:hypothetical protein